MRDVGLIGSVKDFDNYPWPDPESYPVDKFEQASQILPDGMKKCFIMRKIYTAAWMLMGSDSFFRSLINNPDLVSALFDKIAGIQIDILKKISSAFDFGCLSVLMTSPLILDH